MSSAAAMDEAYAAFLSSSALDAWQSSLEAYGALLDGSHDVRDARPADVLHALTLCVYVMWLARCYGADEHRDRAARRFGELGARAARMSQPGGREGALIHAVCAAGKGYAAAARGLVEGLAEAPPVEIALLVAPERPARNAAFLKPFVVDGAGHRFVPALYFYASALLDLGYQSDAARLLTQHRAAVSSPLVVDLRGQLFELDGAWREARDEYGRSGWASHAYRRAIGDVILGGSVDRVTDWPPEDAKKVAAAMLDFGGETDRAGVLRSASFVRACRWSGFDNWLVRFELGRLGFQRRRHAEAEAHLAAAAHSAPAPYRYAVCSLRFTNLTWLGGAMDVDMTPETLEAGHAALRESAPEAHKASIRTWPALYDEEPGVLDPVTRSGDDYHIGIAHKRRGAAADALASWCSCVGRDYTPRAFFESLQAFASYGFERTASRLAAAVGSESADRFFDTWELAGVIAGVLGAESPAPIHGGLLRQQLAAIEDRMEALVGSEFQNAIRAADHFVGRKRAGPARRALARAEKLAEGSEELLLLAIARRRAAGGGWDPRALEALHRAQRQSTSRFERLLIALEFVRLKRFANAKAILREEGVLSSTPDLTPIEYVLALKCAASCFDERERRDLEAAATEALRRDVNAGRFLRYPERFRDRLQSCVGRPLEIAVPAREEDPGAGRPAGRAPTDEPEPIRPDRGGEQELHLPDQGGDEVGAAGLRFARFARCGRQLDGFDAQLRAISRLRPTVPDDEMPAARDVRAVRPRARQIAQRWRAYLLETEPARAGRQLDELRAVLARERELTERWDRLCDAEAGERFAYALAYAAGGAELLGAIRSDAEARTVWPPFLGVEGAVADDARALAARLRERAASVRARAVR